jgi:hypothetical protein|tara:strand:- start:854 stop:1036 length:183 start_codon:yes stop_codon:yes gene_type:complete
MLEQELRLEMLKLAVSHGSAANIKDPIALAESYMAWVQKSEDKPEAAPRRKPKSKADQSA